MRRLLLVLIPISLLAAACGDDDPAVDGSATEDAGHDDGGHDEPAAVADGARVIEVLASSFAFAPSEVRVAAGEEVAIELTSQDAEHDFVIEDVDLHVVAADAGRTEVGGLTAPAAGTYTFYCAVAGHRSAGMEGTLVVS